MKHKYQNEEQIDGHKRLLVKKMKTIESIGTFNQTPENFDYSIVCRRDIFVNDPFNFQEKDKQLMSLSNVSKISKFQIGQNNISKKTMYQSQININNSKLHNKSLDKSSITKSIEKHSLRPTNTPNFNKFSLKNINQSKKQVQKEEYTLPHKINELHEKNNSEVQLNQYFISSSLKSHEISNLETINKLENYNFQYQLQREEQEIQKQNQHEDIKLEFVDYQQNTPKKINFQQISQIRTKQNVVSSVNQFKKENLKCSCEDTLRQFMELTHSKMAQITERLMSLETENFRLKNLEQQLNKSKKTIQNFKQQVQNVENQNSVLKQSNYSYLAEKQQLEDMLKQILFKRQKQKLQNVSNFSKQNTFRHNQNKSKQKVDSKKKQFNQFKENFNNQILSSVNLTPSSNNKNSCQNYQNQVIPYKKQIGFDYRLDSQSDHQRQHKKGMQPIISNSKSNMYFQSYSEHKNVKQKVLDSKMKVQSLLSKLQIKVQRN